MNFSDPQSLTAQQYSNTELWLHNLGIHNFYIRPNGKVDVQGDASVWLEPGKHVLDVQFGTIYGTFDISNTPTVSISGFPEIVNGNLMCHRTNIMSLSGIDKAVTLVTGFIRVNHDATHLLGLLLIDGVKKIDTGAYRRDIILNKYIGTGDIISAQDELIEAEYLLSARL